MQRQPSNICYLLITDILMEGIPHPLKRNQCPDTDTDADTPPSDDSLTTSQPHNSFNSSKDTGNPFALDGVSEIYGARVFNYAIRYSKLFVCSLDCLLSICFFLLVFLLLFALMFVSFLAWFLRCSSISNGFCSSQFCAYKLTQLTQLTLVDSVFHIRVSVHTQ